jgi:hypothetical protein
VSDCPHNRVILTMHAPVYVTVDRALVEGEYAGWPGRGITRVRVNDEGPLDWESHAECADCGGSLAEAGIGAVAYGSAVEIAEAADSWPAWEIGS